MSQCYWLTLSESVTRQIRSRDQVTYPIELSDILPPDEMRALLRQMLLEQGFVENEEGRLSATGTVGEVITVDLDAMEVVAELESEHEFSQDIVGTGMYDEDFGAEGKKLAREEAKSDIERQRVGAEKAADAVAKRKQNDLSKTLDDSDANRLRQLNEVVQRVYAEALKRKAHQLGDVVSVQESTSPQGEYQLTIKDSQ